MFGESDTKLKIKSLQGIRAKFFTAFICSTYVSNCKYNSASNFNWKYIQSCTALEEKYSFLYFIVFLILLRHTLHV